MAAAEYSMLSFLLNDIYNDHLDCLYFVIDMKLHNNIQVIVVLTLTNSLHKFRFSCFPRNKACTSFKISNKLQMLCVYVCVCVHLREEEMTLCVSFLAS